MKSRRGNITSPRADIFVDQLEGVKFAELSQNTISADENSIYRALNRLAQSGVVDSEVQTSETGPNRRYFFLTDLGRELLIRFITRNIQVFQQPTVANLLQKTILSKVQ